MRTEVTEVRGFAFLKVTQNLYWGLGFSFTSILQVQRGAQWKIFSELHAKSFCHFVHKVPPPSPNPLPGQNNTVL